MAVSFLFLLGDTQGHCVEPPFRFFRDPWNLFDFTIVAACLLEPIYRIASIALRLVVY